LEDLLLALDRQAILGRLSAGLVHALNNVLGGVIGQADLILISGKQVQFQKDIDQIIAACNQGVKLTKSLTHVITTMQESHPADPKQIIEALHTLLSRIFRRAGVQHNSASSAMLAAAKNGDEFTQACFHLLLKGYEAVAAEGAPSRVINSRLDSDGSSLRFEIYSQTPLIESAASNDSLPQVDWLKGGQWHYWVISAITRRVRGSWEVLEEGCKATLIWPASSSGSAII